MGGMNLRKWRSNNPVVLASFAETETALKAPPHLSPAKVVREEWRPNQDEFVFEMSALI